MAATDITKHFNLPIFKESDTTDWLDGGFNQAMNKLDSNLHRLDMCISQESSSVEVVSNQLDILSTSMINLSNQIEDLQKIPEQVVSFETKVETDISTIRDVADSAVTKATNAQTTSIENSQQIMDVRGSGFISESMNNKVLYDTISSVNDQMIGNIFSIAKEVSTGIETHIELVGKSSSKEAILNLSVYSGIDNGISFWDSLSETNFNPYMPLNFTKCYRIGGVSSYDYKSFPSSQIISVSNGNKITFKINFPHICFKSSTNRLIAAQLAKVNTSINLYFWSAGEIQATETLFADGVMYYKGSDK